LNENLFHRTAKRRSERILLPFVSSGAGSDTIRDRLFQRLRSIRPWGLPTDFGCRVSVTFDSYTPGRTYPASWPWFSLLLPERFFFLTCVDYWPKNMRTHRCGPTADSFSLW